MTAIDLLTNDHREVLDMIEQLENGTEASGLNLSRAELFNRIKSAIQLHSQLEEQIFYPALQSFDETRTLIEESFDEHQMVDEILLEMSNTNPRDGEWTDLLAELRDNLEHHIEEEENDLFPKAESVLGMDRLGEMGDQMQQVKESNPHAA